MDDVQIVAVADIIKDRAQSAATRFVAKAYADYRDMLGSEKLDALYICVPPFAHDQQEIIAAGKGIHLFVEKPVAVSLDKARRIRDVVTQSGIFTAVGYHWRYQSNTDRAREMLAGKTVGMLMGYWMGGMPEVCVVAEAWKSPAARWWSRPLTSSIWRGICVER